MICQVVINDFHIARRMLYVLDDSDFVMIKARFVDTDDLLIALQKNAMFEGRTHWCDLEIKHFHVMIVNMLNIIGKQHDTIRINPGTPENTRLTFLLCSLITLLQKQSGSLIELFRINRVSVDDVIYDYSASLNVKIEANHARMGLKVVIDNEDF
jgi:hypothetical protein